MLRDTGINASLNPTVALVVYSEMAKSLLHFFLIFLGYLAPGCHDSP